jgi:hypothetical protein
MSFFVSLSLAASFICHHLEVNVSTAGVYIKLKSTKSSSNKTEAYECLIKIEIVDFVVFITMPF